MCLRIPKSSETYPQSTYPCRYPYPYLGIIVWKLKTEQEKKVLRHQQKVTEEGKNICTIYHMNQLGHPRVSEQSAQMDLGNLWQIAFGLTLFKKILELVFCIFHLPHRKDKYSSLFIFIFLFIFLIGNRKIFTLRSFPFIYQSKIY